MPDLVIQSRLRPYIPAMYEWAFTRFREACESRGIRALAIYRPNPQQERETREYLELVEIADLAGLELIDLFQAFDSVSDRNTLVLASWDTHTNARGHELLAEALYTRLVPILFEAGTSAEIEADERMGGVPSATYANQKQKEIHEPGRNRIDHQNVYSQ